MEKTSTIEESVQRGGGKRGRQMPKHGKGFARGAITPAQANAIRWSKDRRTLVAMAQEARPEAFDTVLSIMRDPKVEPPTRLRAGELVLAYSDGRPRQQLDLNIGAPRELHTLSNAELEAIAAGAPPPFALVDKGNVIEGEVLQPVQAPVKSVPRSVQNEKPAEN